jgi:hypothetical protein
MRRFYIFTNMYDNLLHIQEDVLKKHNVLPDEDWEIDVFDESDRLITTLHNKDTSTH